jgi:hypothetical protein
MVREIPAAGNIIHVRDRVLASALLMVGVPLKTDLVAGEPWVGMSNVYSAKNPARVNNVRVPGVETYYFRDRTIDGKIPTLKLVAAWDDAGRLQDGESAQAVREVNRITSELRRDGLSEVERNRLCDELDFWQTVSYIQAVRVAMSHVQNLSALMVDARALRPKAKDFLVGRTRFLPLSPSQL